MNTLKSGFRGGKIVCRLDEFPELVEALRDGDLPTGRLCCAQLFDFDAGESARLCDQWPKPHNEICAGVSTVTSDRPISIGQSVVKNGKQGRSREVPVRVHIVTASSDAHRRDSPSVAVTVTDERAAPRWPEE